MTVKWHPEFDLLVEYAAGNLCTAQAMMVATHLQYCPHCKSAVNKLEILGGELMSKTPNSSSETVSPDVWQNTLAAIAKPAPKPQPKRSLMQRIAPNGLSALDWKGLGPVQTAHVDLGDERNGRLSLLKIRAGARVPVHSHHGNEWTLVLEGGFSDHMGKYNAGDFVCLDGNHKHSPVAAVNEDCICMAYVDEQLHFQGWLGPILNRVIKL
ncbi:ChrR family anti-sigma-E factor [Salinibius halmophilus]|uniref:ChrR family anti-sigma-E factor n=1 Tax=Salinibius halmophilus TaxID=1853216 RepID=UPI000E66AF07|nr:ChrR family anti-sigma-E factor [Salinibius halmophilus]